MSVHYDPMLAKLIVHALDARRRPPTRDHGAARITRSSASAPTSRSCLQILEHPQFVERVDRHRVPRSRRRRARRGDSTRLAISRDGGSGTHKHRHSAHRHLRHLRHLRNAGSVLRHLGAGVAETQTARRRLVSRHRGRRALARCDRRRAGCDVGVRRRPGRAHRVRRHAARRAGARKDAATASVMAPMPATVVAINAAAGQTRHRRRDHHRARSDEDGAADQVAAQRHRQGGALREG